MPVFSDQEYAEEIRLKYRFLDLRRKKIHENIYLRSKVFSFILNEMSKFGFFIKHQYHLNLKVLLFFSTK